MKSLPKIALTIYTLLLLWLVLFKTSIDIPSVLTDLHMQKLNLIPFTGHISEMIENFIIFIPLGLLASASFKNITLWKKLSFIFCFSLLIEATQYILAIGVSDITDVITNTLGGLVGLVAYKISHRHESSEKADQIIVLITTILIVLCIFLRFFVFRVKY